MTSRRDDCYFFYYSTCTKGDGCLFRHCEAALGNETICSLWREGQCFTAACKFRHMEIPINRKEIPCFWEKQATGCQKPHCPFLHQKPCYMKENQELVPCPIHPPVVLNLADDYDDDDDDGQFSEDGEDGKLAPSPKKLHKSDDSLNTGVSTGEEIQLQSALKAGMTRADCPIQSAEASVEKENVRSLIRPALLNSRDEAGRPRGGVAARHGGKILTTDVKREGLSLKRSLAERLGGVVDNDLPSEPPQKVFKTMKERLGPISVQVAPAQPADTSEAPQKGPEQICIINLEGIRQEKAQHQSQRVPALLPTPKITRTRTSTVKGPKRNKRFVTIQDSSLRNVQIVSKTLPAKRKRKREEDEPNQSPSPKKAKITAESQELSDTAAPPQKSPDMEGVRFKTLQEIHREKAARLQVQQAADSDVKKSSDSKEESIKRPLSLHLQKPPGQRKQTGKVTPEKTADETMKPVKPAAPLETTVMVKVKSFEEIMREKRMRMQEAQSKGAAVEVSRQSGTPAAPLKRKRPAQIVVSSAGSSAAPVPGSSQKSPARKPAVKSESASTSAVAAVASVPLKPKSSLQTSVDTKVQPELNVKSGKQMRRAKRSTVAVVKPLNSSSTVQETACGHSQVPESFSVKAQLSSAVPGSPSSLLEAGSTSGPLRKKLRTVSISKENQSQESQPAAKEACAVPQSPVLKSPTRPKSRRSTVDASCSASTGVSSSSAEDDFEELMEFTDDDLEDYMELSDGDDDMELSFGEDDMELSFGEDDMELSFGDDDMELSFGEDDMELSFGEDDMELSFGEDDLHDMTDC